MLIDGLRSSARAIRRQPALSVLAVLTLALGIALCTALFSILRGIVFRPLGAGDRLVAVGVVRPSAGAPEWSIDPALLATWRERQRSFERLSAFRMHYAFVTGPRGTRTYGAAEVDAGFFALLGTSPVIGRTFAPGEGADGAEPVAVLSFEAWQELFGGDPGAVGGSLLIDSRRRTVIGVMPAGFAFPVDQRVWLPMRAPPAPSPGAEAPVQVAGTLRPDVGPGQAEAELTAVLDGASDLSEVFEPGTAAMVEPYVVAFTDRRILRAVAPMAGAVLGVLLIACANVTMLFLARAVRRSRQAAIAIAIGATRRRLVAQILVEAMMLALLAGGVGLALAAGGVELFNRTVAPSDFLQGFWIDVRIDPQAAGFVLAVSVVAATLAAILPALWVSGTDPGVVLRAGGASGISGRSAIREGRGLVVAEIAVTSALLIASLLMTQTILRLRSIDPGFEAEAVLTGRVSIAQRPSTGPLDSLGFFRELSDRIGRLPGVRGVAFASMLPTRDSFWSDVEVEGTGEPPSRRARWLVISPGFFEVFGVDLVAGRDFDSSDFLVPEVAIVNQSFVRSFMGDADPLGRRIRVAQAGKTFTVVGVVPDLLMGSVGDDRGEAAVYLSHAAMPRASMEIAVKVEGAAAALAPTLEREVGAVDPLAASFYVMTMSDLLDRRHWVYDALARLFAAFGIGALVLSTVGLYGTLAYSARSRLREYGVRLAIGAHPGDLLRSVLRSALLQVGIGLLAGIVLAAVSTRFLSALLFGVDPWSPAAYGLVVALMLGSGLAAALVPARIAARADPTSFLRWL